VLDQNGIRKEPWNTCWKDVVFENAVLFLQDALISCEFSDAVKAGDSG